MRKPRRRKCRGDWACAAGLSHAAGRGCPQAFPRRTCLWKRRSTTAVAPELVGRKGVGPDTASTFLVSVGDNPHRWATNGPSASLAGANPIPASSGKTTRHRLNRGGDRQLNSALWRIAIVRSLPTLAPAPSSNVVSAKAGPRSKPSAASSAISRVRSSRRYPKQPPVDSRSLGSVRSLPSTPRRSRPRGGPGSVLGRRAAAQVAAVHDGAPFRH